MRLQTALPKCSKFSKCSKCSGQLPSILAVRCACPGVWGAAARDRDWEAVEDSLSRSPPAADTDGRAPLASRVRGTSSKSPPHNVVRPEDDRLPQPNFERPRHHAVRKGGAAALAHQRTRSFHGAQGCAAAAAAVATVERRGGLHAGFDHCARTHTKATRAGGPREEEAMRCSTADTRLGEAYRVSYRRPDW